VALFTNDHLTKFIANDEDAASSDARRASYHKAVGLEWTDTLKISDFASFRTEIYRVGSTSGLSIETTMATALARSMASRSLLNVAPHGSTSLWPSLMSK
jgi:hypothetical protein